jgi:hypothetical protein
MAERTLEQRVAALEARLAQLDRENELRQEQLSELGFVLHAFMYAAGTELAAHADGGQSPEQWTRLFIGDLHDFVDHAEHRPVRPDWMPFERVGERVRAQIDWLAGVVGRAAHWM